jgi:predicted TIM-barrel fold metal-dependent hydrolase
MGLSLDMANVDVDLLQTTVAVSDKVPELRMILDHSPSFTPRPQDRAAYDAALKEIAKRPNVFTKLSWNVITREMTDHVVGGRPVPGLDGYKDRLDTLTGTFGEDRVMFCTNYPQTVGPIVTRVDQIARLTKAYYADKPRAVAEKFFWRNALKTYGWVKRAPAQPA